MRRGSAICATKLLKQSAKNAGESSATNTLDYAVLVESISAPNVSPLRASLTRALSATAARNSDALSLRDRARKQFVFESVLGLDPLKGPGTPYRVVGMWFSADSVRFSRRIVSSCLLM